MLEVKHLYKKYGEHTVLEDLNFQLAPGEIFCMLGQNGAGKTTTINILLGLLSPTSGHALIDGIDTDHKSVREKIAYIPEVVKLYPDLSGLENLDFLSRLAGFKYSKEELSKLLSYTHLQEDAFSRKLSQYSKGMCQKVGIAIAIAKKARYILMDEPTSGLDPKSSVEFAELCKHLSTQNIGVFMVTHDIFNAVNIGHRIGIIKNGKLVYEAETKGISAQELQELYIKTI